MKQLLNSLLLAVLLSVGAASCTKCVVCTDKTSTTFTRSKYCDKDLDKGDVDQAIKNAEANGESCHAESVVL